MGKVLGFVTLVMLSCSCFAQKDDVTGTYKAGNKKFYLKVELFQDSTFVIQSESQISGEQIFEDKGKWTFTDGRIVFITNKNIFKNNSVKFIYQKKSKSKYLKIKMDTKYKKYKTNRKMFCDGCPYINQKEEER